MKELSVDHIAIAVHDLAEAVPLYERLTGSRGSTPETVASQGVKVVFVGILELIQPTDPEGSIARFLERRGQGMHHVAYRVDDCASELERLVADGFEAIDRVPRPGAGGHLVAFLHPKSTGGTLIELVEHTSTD